MDADAGADAGADADELVGPAGAGAGWLDDGRLARAFLALPEDERTHSLRLAPLSSWGGSLPAHVPLGDDRYIDVEWVRGDDRYIDVEWVRGVPNVDAGGAIGDADVLALLALLGDERIGHVTLRNAIFQSVAALGRLITRVKWGVRVDGIAGSRALPVMQTLVASFQPTLTTIDVNSRAGFGDACIELLAEYLGTGEHRELTSLLVTDHAMTQRGFDALFRALARGTPCLRYLFVYTDRVGDRVHASVMDFLRSTRKSVYPLQVPSLSDMFHGQTFAVYEAALKVVNIRSKVLPKVLPKVTALLAAPSYQRRLLPGRLFGRDAAGLDRNVPFPMYARLLDTYTFDAAAFSWADTADLLSADRDPAALVLRRRLAAYLPRLPISMLMNRDGDHAIMWRVLEFLLSESDDV